MAIKILHIGAGIRGGHWLKFVQDYPDAITVACVDADPQALELVKRTHGIEHCQYFTDVETALNKVKADAALITSPSFLHAEHSIRSLQAGLAVMVEKPFTCDVNEAREVIEQANRSGKPVVVAENFRFVPAERTVRKLVQDGIIGEIASVTLVDRRRMPSHTQGPWMATIDYPQLQEIAVHHFDSLRSLFCRQPLNIVARAWNPPASDYRHGACTEALIEMEGGLHIQYLGTLTSHRFEYRLWIEGEHGMIWTNRKFVLWRKRGQRLFRPVKQVKVPRGDEAPFPKEGSTSLLNSLRDAILLSQEAETSAQQNIWTIAMVEAARRSDKERRVVSIDEVLPRSPSTGQKKQETLYNRSSQGLLQPVGSPVSRRKKGELGARVLVVGLDSADAELIDRWCQEGYLPTLAMLRRQGLWGSLRTTAEVMHVSAWPSLYTGTMPGKHGMYHAYQIRAGEQDVHRTRADECALPPFWKFIDEAGRNCIVMDAFMNYPLEGFRGIQILEYGTWTWFAEPLATPNGVWKEIVRQFGPYPAPEHTRVLTRPDPARFREQLLAGAAVKGKAIKWLLRDKPWDMFFVTFGEPHPAGHYLWHLEDNTFPAHPAHSVAGLDYAVRDVYMAVDTVLGEILRGLDDSVTVIVTSGDGMGPNFAGCHLLPDILNRLGLFFSASFAQQGPANGGSITGSRIKKSLSSTIRDAIPLGVRRSVARCLPRALNHRLSMKWTNANIDWAKTKAFCLPNANEGYVRLNLRGREPRGTVESGAACDELIAELKAAFDKLVNPQNSRKAAEQIICTDEVFPGAQRNHLPDLVLNWDIKAKVLAELASDKTGPVRKDAGYETAPYYTGNHRPAAFVLARGPRIPEGRSFTGGHIVDIAPTILTMLGVDPPQHMDGRVWGEFVRGASG